MTDVNFSSNAMNYINSLHLHFGSSPAGGSNGGGNDWPWDPNGGNFNINIPYNSDGSVDVAELERRLYNLLYGSHEGNPMDFNTMLNIAGLLMNIAGLHNPSITNQIESFLNLQLGGSSFLHSSNIMQDIMGALIHGYYLQHKNDPNAEAETRAFAQNLINTMGGENSSLLSSLIDAGNTILGGLDAWIHDPKNANISFEDFAFAQGLQWESDFSMNNSTDDFFNEWHHLEIEDLTQKYGKDPFVLYLMIMAILLNENGDIQTQIAGRGNLMKELTKLGDKAKQILSQWQGGHFTADSAKELFQIINTLEILSKDQRVNDAVGPGIDKLFKDFFDKDNGVKVTFQDHNGNKDTMTLGELFYDITHKTDGFTWADMASALNSLSPSAGTPTNSSNLQPDTGKGDDPQPPLPPVTPPGYTQISGDIGEIPTSVTNASTAQGQIIQNIEGVNEKDLAMITAAFNALVNPEKVFTQNMSTAGN